MIRTRTISGLEVLELRSNGTGVGTMIGHFAVFDQWAEIDSDYEGRFMEQIAPGSFARTFAEDHPVPLVQHGGDPSVGSKPLGTVDVLREDDVGAYFEVALVDAPYVRDVLPGLRAGLYGSSFKFRVRDEDVARSPARSTSNPEGLEERTIRDAKVFEFGPVTFPAYAGATAGARSSR